jgi:NAD-dependent deacetylase
MDSKLNEILASVVPGDQRITVLTGAGISAESGIPTFRGPEGYWTVGSAVYHPQEMATNRMFQQNPEEVWKWYLHRMQICRKAEPNPGHLALAEMEKRLNSRFTLITQNVDGLHLRAGNSSERTYQIHGNVFFMRCAGECSPDIYPTPQVPYDKQKGEDLSEWAGKYLRCPACGKWSRPHVLWFDEVYNEKYFRYQSSLAIAEQTDLLIIAGTSGSTNLPNQVAWLVSRKGGAIINIDIERNLFADLALSGRRGHFIKAASGTALPQVVELMKQYLAL